MDYNKLQRYSYEELRNIIKKMGLKIKKSRKGCIEEISRGLNEYEEYKREKLDKYEMIKQIGSKGKEGVVYLVRDNKDREYAMKIFSFRKSSKTLRHEAEMQEMAAHAGVSPVVIDVDTVAKSIVMEKLDRNLVDIMTKQNKNLSKRQQRQIIKIFRALDEAGVLHADPNPLNFMMKGRYLYIIDFGFARPITERMRKKYDGHPNLTLMTIGLILKLKEMGCPKSSYLYMLPFVSKEAVEKFDL